MKFVLTCGRCGAPCFDDVPLLREDSCETMECDFCHYHLVTFVQGELKKNYSE
jgi:Zn ribbon nucleic-acid-binding protein